MSKPSAKPASSGSKRLPLLIGGAILAVAGYLTGNVSASKKTDSLALDLTNLRSEVAQLKTALDTASSGLRSEIEARSGVQDAALAAEKARMDQAAGDIAALKKSLADQESQRTAQKAELDKARAEIQASRQKVEQIVGALSGLGGAKPQ